MTSATAKAISSTPRIEETKGKPDAKAKLLSIEELRRMVREDIEEQRKIVDKLRRRNLN